MKKIVIATPVDFSNFGNRLQNYAVHSICKRYELMPITLAVEYSYQMKIIPKHLLLSGISKLKLVKPLKKIKRLKTINKSVAAWGFTEREIKTVYIRNISDYLEIISDADFFGIGGDQILSPYWRNIVWFATFPDQPSEKKVCFSPSFGTDNLPKKYCEEIVKKELSSIKNPAIREESGCEIALSCTGVKPLHICDPVVMINTEEWKALSEKNSVAIEEPYILVYFLGNTNKEYDKFIEKYRSKGFRIIDVSYRSKQYEATCDPLQFVSLISNAEYVFSDSYHAILMSVILNTGLVIFRRIGAETMNTRIEELVSKYSLRNCYYENCIDFINPIDKSHTQAILEKERATAFEYYDSFFK